MITLAKFITTFSLWLGIRMDREHFFVATLKAFYTFIAFSLFFRYKIKRSELNEFQVLFCSTAAFSASFCNSLNNSLWAECCPFGKKYVVETRRNNLNSVDCSTDGCFRNWRRENVTMKFADKILSISPIPLSIFCYLCLKGYLLYRWH